MGGKSRDEAGELEEQQGINVARAAAKTATLDHYIWSTLPSARKFTGGKILVPHLSVNPVASHSSSRQTWSRPGV